LALASSDTTQSPIAAGSTAVATDEDTAVATSSSINKKPSTQVAVAYKELLSESDDPANDISANRLERQSRIKRGPYQPKLSLSPRQKIGSKFEVFKKIGTAFIID
jgi:hypothetical protein